MQTMAMNSAIHLSAAPVPVFGVRRRVGAAFIAISALFGGIALWSTLVELSGAVIAHGTVVVDRHSKRIQHRDGGIVAAINVRNGDVVRESDVLIRLDETQVRAELGIVQAQLVELRARRARLAAERELAADIEFPSNLLQMAAAAPILEGERRLFLSNKMTRESQELQLRQRVGQLTQESAGYGVQRAAKDRELKLIRKELEIARGLFAQNLTPINKVIAQEREEARIDGDRGNYIAQEARVAGQISEVEQQVLTLRQSARTEAQKELRTVEARIDELAEREVAGLDKLSRMEIRAPQAGVVHELTAHTVGGVVTPAEQIMLIVPEEEKLAVEFKVSPTDIDQVRVGQEARLRFTAFNQRTTPEMLGVVTFVSADISRDPKERQEAFIARAVVDNRHSAPAGSKPILPGMPVEVFLTTEKRSALSYMLKPITDQFERAFKER